MNADQCNLEAPLPHGSSPPRIQRPPAFAVVSKAPPTPPRRRKQVRGVRGQQQRPGEYQDWGRGGFSDVINA